jgi:predicted metal-dependent phosphoesterase TrpH
MHGLIGFQPYWRETQGYAGKNLLQAIVDECFAKDIDVCAITSQENEIVPCSIHDRLGWLREKETKTLPRDYTVGTLGTQALAVAKGRSIVYLVNGQTVNVIDNGALYDHLVIGSNQVPNGRSLRDTLELGRDHGLIQIAAHPFLTKHRGTGYEKLHNNLFYYDAIEGFNAQSYFSRNANSQAKQFAAEKGMPWIATSDAHRIQDLGISYISFADTLDTRSGEALIASLRTAIRDNAFRKHEQYASLSSLFRWIPKFLWGIHANRSRLASESKVPAILSYN